MKNKSLKVIEFWFPKLGTLLDLEWTLLDSWIEKKE